jgi:hypothetical protein
MGSRLTCTRLQAITKGGNKHRPCKQGFACVHVRAYTCTELLLPITTRIQRHAATTSPQWLRPSSSMAPAIVVGISCGHHRQHAMAPALVVNDSGHSCRRTRRSSSSACNRSGRSFLLQGTQPSVVHTLNGWTCCYPTSATEIG